MVKLNQRELELLSVTRDLFLKGSPELRVAKFAHNNHFTEIQLQHFLSKIAILPEPVRLKIQNYFRDIERDNLREDSQTLGKQLSDWLKYQKKVEVSDA